MNHVTKDDVKRRNLSKGGETKRLRGEDEDMGLSFLDLQALESNMQEDMQWSGEKVSDMCETTVLQQEGTLADLWYHDEVTWESLPPDLVAAGEQQELARFKSMGVHSYVLREDAEKDADGVHVKTKWVRVHKGTAEHPQVKCRLVAQELALGERLDELFAGTPSMSAVRLLLLHSRQDGRCSMTMDVKRGFLYGVMRRVASTSPMEY